MAALPGNKNALGNKGPWGERVFRSALLQQLKDKPNKNKLREIAQKLIDTAATGESWAVKEFADRLDGRPHQQIVGTGEDGALTIEIIKFAGTGENQAPR